MVSSVVADIDGDGTPDLVSGGETETAATIAVYLTREDGSFEAPRELEARENLAAVIAADLDGDGDVDLASAHGSVVLTFTNRGTGGFDPATAHEVGGDVHALCAADVAGDSSPDLVAADAARGAVTVLESGQDGAFLSSASFALGGQFPISVAAADFNGDGHEDLVTANRDSKDVSVLLGAGAGVFEEAVTYASGGSAAPTRVTVAELSGDGHADLLLATRANPAVLLGKSDGTFGEASKIRVRAETVVAVDVDRDGKIDLAIPPSGSRSVTLWLGDGTGSFELARSIDAGFVVETVHAADLDRDDDRDLILASNRPRRLGVLWAGESSPFRFRSLSGRMDTRPHGAATADFDDDGVPDVFTANGSNSAVTVAFGRALLEGVPPLQVPIGCGGCWWTSAATGDFDGDGDVDAVAADEQSHLLGLIRNDGGGSMSPWTRVHTSRLPLMVATADVDADGDLDLLNVSGSERLLTVHLGDGAGGFGERQDYAVGVRPRSLASGDFDGDLDLDLAAANVLSREVSILHGVGDGTFSDATQLPIVGTPRFVVTGDVDGDGDLDLVTSNGDTNDATVLENRGDGTFVTAGSFPIDAEAFSMTTGDVDGNGTLDLIAAVEVGQVVVLLGNGDGTFELPFKLRVGSGSRWAVTADFNRDGRLDIASANREERTLTLLLSEDGNADPASPCADVPFQRADVDADGTVDLADGVFLLNHLFLRGPPPLCRKGADANDDGAVNLIDAVSLLEYLWREGAAPAAPFNACGSDPTPDRLDCAAFAPCG